MKIKCDFCGTSFNDSEERCPDCGAAREYSTGQENTAENKQEKITNASEKKVPETIEELKDWYKARNLPPSDVTRIFIGVDYKKPKAFGIYRDESTGEYVVYKNKASGERAIRYRGKDQAHAVNELYLKIKDEIAARKGNGSVSRSSSSNGKGKKSLIKRILSGGDSFLGCLGCSVLIAVGSFLIFVLVILLIMAWEFFFSSVPHSGYYYYNDTVYVKAYSEYYEIPDLYWYKYDKETGEWLFPISNELMPEEMQTKKSSKKYMKSYFYKSDYEFSNFDDSVYYKDIQAGNYAEESYYRYESTIYYHLDNEMISNWYVFDSEWKYVDFWSMPDDMQHSSYVSEYKTDYEAARSYKADDFTETLFYKDSKASHDIKKGYYSYDDTVYYHLYDDYESGWYYYDDYYSDWRSTSSAYLPEVFRHNSIVEDYYSASEWYENDEYSNFEDTAYYDEYLESQKQSYDDDDDDSFWDWDSDDSWDYDDSDWDSDW